MLDNIEMSLGSAKNYVGKANVKLGEAKDDHSAARKVINNNYIIYRKCVVYYWLE